MIRLLTTCASLALIFTAVACGDFGDRKVCTPQANPGCIPDLNDFTVPDGNGPNPNFPDPSAVPPSMEHDDVLSAPAHLSSFNINEVLLSSADGSERQVIELAYSGEAALSLEGYTLRSGEHELALTETILASGDFMTIELGVDHAPDASVRLGKTAGSLALIAADGQIVDFVQWGKAGQALEAEAVLDGQWTAGTFAVTPIVGASLCFYAYYGTGNEVANYWAQTPSIGEINPARENVPVLK